MFTRATKNFGVWKEERRSSKISFIISSSQYLFALSILAFIVFITFIVVAKIRQEFFLVEAAQVYLYKDSHTKSSFYTKERPSAISVFIRKDSNNSLNIVFEDGSSYVFPKDKTTLEAYLLKRKNNIIYLAMILRINKKQNSRVKILTQRNISFEDIHFIMKLFSQYGFDSFDIGVEKV